jgi:hypothetical protein
MKEGAQLPVTGCAGPPATIPPVSELGRQLQRVWEQLDAQGDEPLTLDQLQREALEDAD